MIRSLTTGLAAAALAAIGAAAPAHAAIRCDGGYQINSQGEFESPYCQEQVLAKLSGVPVGTIRGSLGAEQNACRMVGGDIRISQFCGIINPRSHHRCTVPPCF